MTVDSATIRDWLTEAHQWLTAFSGPRFHQSLRVLTVEMQAALNGSHQKVRQLREHIGQLAHKLSFDSSSASNERSIVLAKCAFASYEIKDLLKAVELLKLSLELCDRDDNGHFEATALWMLGCLQWEMAQTIEAIVSWERSMALYKSLRNQSADYLSSSTTLWYIDKINIMNSALDDALSDMNAASSTANYDVASFQVPSDMTSESDVEGSTFSEQDILRLFTISDDVWAGNFKSTNGNGDSIEYLEVNLFQINGQIYQMINLRSSSKVLRFGSGKEYVVARVRGDSMNAEGIDEDDYVLLRIQNAAENNDIVAAKIQDADTEATLKKFLRRADQIILQFRSRNPIHKDVHGRDRQFEFTAEDEYEKRFEIIGVAQAVFKPFQ